MSQNERTRTTSAKNKCQRWASKRTRAASQRRVLRPPSPPIPSAAQAPLTADQALASQRPPAPATTSHLSEPPRNHKQPQIACGFTVAAPSAPSVLSRFSAVAPPAASSCNVDIGGGGEPPPAGRARGSMTSISGVLTGARLRFGSVRGDTAASVGDSTDSSTPSSSTAAAGLGATALAPFAPPFRELLRPSFAARFAAASAAASCNHKQSLSNWTQTSRASADGLWT